MKQYNNLPVYVKIAKKQATRVEKIDDTDTFDAIKTGIKDISNKSITNKVRTVYKAWLNRPELQDLIITKGNKLIFEWVADKRVELEQRIRKRVQDDNLSNSSLRGGLEAIAHLLLAYDKVQFREYVRHLWSEGIVIQRAIDKKGKKSKLTEKEIDNYVCYQDLVRMREKLYKEWQMIKAVQLSGSRGGVTREMKLKANMKHLIVALNVLIPPLRKTWTQFSNKHGDKVDMELWKKKTPPPNNYVNYLWEKTPGSYTLVINYDKIEAKRTDKYQKERQEIELADEIPNVTQGRELNKILKQSFEEFPREYVIIGVRSAGSDQRPMIGSSYDKIIKSLFPQKEMNQNLLRKAYINYYHRQNLDEETLETIADRMRHTVSVARAKYLKVNIPKCAELGKAPALKPVKPREPIVVQEPEEEKDKIGGYFDPVAYSKKYRADNAEKIKKQRKEYYDKNKERVLRSKVIWHLNKNKVKKPQKCTIDRYGLVHDGEEWTSTMDDEKNCVRTRSRQRQPEPAVKEKPKKKVVVKRVSTRAKKPTRKVR